MQGRVRGASPNQNLGDFLTPWFHGFSYIEVNSRPAVFPVFPEIILGSRGEEGPGPHK